MAFAPSVLAVLRLLLMLWVPKRRQVRVVLWVSEVVSLYQLLSGR